MGGPSHDYGPLSRAPRTSHRLCRTRCTVARAHVATDTKSRENAVPFRTMVTGKIHRARVTAADLHYVGSITIDQDLLDAAGILPYERVQVVDIDNGARLETYTIPGEHGSGEIQLNGAAARLVAPGDLVIVMAYQLVETPVDPDFHPRVVLVDPATNTIEALITRRDDPGALVGATMIAAAERHELVGPDGYLLSSAELHELAAAEREG